MSKTLKFTLITVWIVLSRAYDAYSTYQYTPDLSQEANPLVSLLGMEWGPLLLLLSLLMVYCIYAFFRRTFYPLSLEPREKGYSFSEFLAYTYLGRKGHWTGLFYRLPNSLSRFHQYMGQLLTPSLAFAGIVSTLMWLLLNYTTTYPQYHRAWIIYGILIIGSLLITLRWNWRAYRAYQSQWS